jgi:hypothetical protein
MLNQSSFIRMVKQGKLTIFKVTLSDTNKAIETRHMKELLLEEDVPKYNHEFLPQFSKVLADRLPPHIPRIDLEVWLRDRETPTWVP